MPPNIGTLISKNVLDDFLHSTSFFVCLTAMCSTSIQPGWFVILIQHDGKPAFSDPIILWGQAVEEQMDENKQDKPMKAGPVDFKIPRSYLWASHSCVMSNHRMIVQRDRNCKCFVFHHIFQALLPVRRKQGKRKKDRRIRLQVRRIVTTKKAEKR